MDIWPTVDHCADQFAPPTLGQVGGCGRLPLGGSSVPHNPSTPAGELLLSERFQVLTSLGSSTHTQPSQLESPGRGWYLIWTSCQRHVVHHIVQGGLQVHLCWSSPKSHLKGHWSFFWYLAHAREACWLSSNCSFYLRPQQKSPVEWTCWTG